MKSLLSKSICAILCAGLLTTLMGVQPAYAAGIVVNTNADTVANDGICTLREAITAANTDLASGSMPGECGAGSGTDTITFAANYTITLIGSQLATVTSSVTITGNGAANTIVQASANPNIATYRVFEVNSTGNLTLNNLTVRNGRCAGACTTQTFSGGGIYNFGTLTIKDSALSGNSAIASGGGIVNSGSLTITNSGLFDNSAGSDGGGIGNLGSLTITNSELSGNSAGSDGGGIASTGTGIMTLANSTLSGNSAGSGGGIANFGSLTITNSALSGNSVFNAGGGIYNFGTLTVTNSTLSGNLTTFGSGGGIYNFGILTVTNSTLSGNLASLGSGGGIVSLLGPLNYANTIIANSGGTDCYTSGSVVTSTNNLVENNAPAPNNCGTPAITSDPNLGPLADNGGPTQTMALLPGSPALNAGDAAICANAPVSGKDQRGVTRPQGAGCDIGAYEFDDTFPTVVSHSLQASYTTGPSSFTVTFSENVNDPSGNSGTDDATNPANYLLVEAGANSVFNTISCAGGLGPDDTKPTVSGVSYNSAAYTSTVTLASALPNGQYRLFVCGTTSIVDIAANPLNNGADFTFDFTVSAGASTLPDSGFAPNIITSLPAKPAHLAHTDFNSIWLEIPSLNLKTNIVGVPQSGNNWDVRWLGWDAGWLNGTAFPTWEGNSVITAHVYDANGLPGPFANLKSLKSGDHIIVHLYSEKYIFEVRTTQLVRPESTKYALEHLEDYSYLTLITCQSYNESNDTYLFRRIVRAVLVDVQTQ